jgi:hypothetical protein
MKSTVIRANHKSTCPGCAQNIFPGSLTQVYSNKWYHTECWKEMWEKIALNKDKEKGIEIMPLNKLYTQLTKLVLQIEADVAKIKAIAKEIGSW